MKRKQLSKVVDHQRTGNGQLVAKKLWKSLFGIILEKNCHTDVDSLVPAAKSGQITGISLANVGCTFNGINPPVAIKL